MVISSVEAVSEGSFAATSASWIRIFEYSGSIASPRQAAFHHKFDVITGKALWIVTAGRRDLQERYKRKYYRDIILVGYLPTFPDLTSEGAKAEGKSYKTPIECFRSSLAPHSIFGAWAVENWRWYIESLENSLEDATGLAVLGLRETGEDQKYQPGDLQTLQRHEEMVHETLAALEANMRVFASLYKFYSCLRKNEHFHLRHDVAESIEIFRDQVEEFISDIDHLVQRASTLLKITDGRKQLIVQHFQS
ncbi:hypothetical protein F5B22DRAFT_646955 [Xylaria bambusicola]|uniref:uncharacterized protein n=1 Tax=Xylaria bambusicola TaxID=326684 RepID=UPI002008D5B0|nr:uncharacterized protein F5B22DRAFT_646955 [Xylaria bambusicola]KAI0515078.1 hypothetical protein F5B22DRAFT_646955 [Xylaria bambusicola]